MVKEVEVHRLWLLPENEESLIKRLHDIVSGDNFKPLKKENGSWQLDGTNDWWARLEGGRLFISSRYGGEKLKTLVEFCKAWMS